MAAWLTSVTGADPSAIHVAIEVPHGPVVETLLERGFNVYAINPKQLDRFRDRFSRPALHGPGGVGPGAPRTSGAHTHDKKCNS
jgi:hypothetical protein